MQLFITLIYQPFFNILVFTYWVLEKLTGGNADMGIAVIIFTIIVRFIMLPMSLRGHRTEEDRRKIMADLAQLEKDYVGDHIGFEKARKGLLKTNNSILFGELVSLVIQVSLALMLWKMFKTGLEGADLHLLYPFMPDVATPYNLMFLGKYDLSHPNVILNIIQSSFIFIFETLSAYYSRYRVTRAEVVRLQLVLPVVSFILFMGLPAGKKLFVITTLAFSIVLMIIRIVMRSFSDYKYKKEQESVQPQEEKIVVATR
ncbi:YidC/Oxa1 family membrane protein insertase [Candidatus Woesebacteria bacterium]|nr:YidC/Oxa1 family membrane protein insertase [Candidatus Woesebacteria bacterium]